MTKHEATLALADKLLEELRSNLSEIMWYDKDGKTTDIVQINLRKEFSLIDDIQVLINSLD
jgi:hypothetical protein